MTPTLSLFSPSGVVPKAADLRLAARRLKAMGFDATLDEAALARHQRFAGDDATRLAAIHRVAAARPDVALASRGGYGLTRLLDAIDYRKLARAVDGGTRWVGHSDFTALQCALYARTGASSWAGPMAIDHFSRSQADGGVDEVTAGCFGEAMRGELEALGFRTEVGHDGVQARGVLWGGNLAMLCSLLGTRHFPAIKGGILFLEEVGEYPYRVERMLMQLQQAGVLAAQKAVLLGHITAARRSPLDRGFGLKGSIQHLRSLLKKTPLLTGLPVGHVPMLVTLPFGVPVRLAVQGRDAFIGWGHP